MEVHERTSNRFPYSPYTAENVIQSSSLTIDQILNFWFDVAAAAAATAAVVASYATVVLTAAAATAALMLREILKYIFSK